MIKLKSLILENEESESLKKETEEFMKHLENKYPQLEDLYFYIASDRSLYISSIKVKLEDRHAGIGSSVIREIQKFADERGLTITLSPEAQRGYTKKLDRFYKDLGFVDNRGRNKDYRLGGAFGRIMYRRPRKSIGETESYVGHHSAPEPDTGSPLYDLTLNKTYPDDVYRTLQHYKTGDDKCDNESLYQIQRCHNRPRIAVRIYRAVPKNVNKINDGDWVSLSRSYCKLHAMDLENPINDMKIISMVVRSRDVWNNGDSINEWGYVKNPDPGWLNIHYKGKPKT